MSGCNLSQTSATSGATTGSVTFAALNEGQYTIDVTTNNITQSNPNPPLTTTFSYVGQIIPYTYTITNNGNILLGAVNMEGKINGTTSSTSSCVAPSVTSLSIKPRGYGNYTVTQADINAATAIKNSITATQTTIGGITTSPSSITYNPSSNPTGAAIVSPAPILSNISFTGVVNPSSYSFVGSLITFTYTVKNNSTDTNFTNLAIINSLSGAVTNYSTTTLGPGATSTITVSYTVTSAGANVSNVASLFANTFVSNVNSFYSSAQITLTSTYSAPSNPTITFGKANTVSPTPTYNSVGQSIQYAITFISNQPVSALEIYDPMFQTTALVSSIAVAANTTYTVPASLTKYTIKQSDIDRGFLFNSAYYKVTYANGTKATSNPVASSNPPIVPYLLNTSVQNPQLLLTKSANPTNYSTVGQNITYTFTITNTGNVTLHNFTLSNTTNGNGTFTHALGTGGTVNLTSITTLPPTTGYNVATYQLIYTTTQADIDNQLKLTNDATIRAQTICNTVPLAGAHIFAVENLPSTIVAAPKVIIVPKNPIDKKPEIIIDRSAFKPPIKLAGASTINWVSSTTPLKQSQTSANPLKQSQQSKVASKRSKLLISSPSYISLDSKDYHRHHHHHHHNKSNCKTCSKH